ncbi:M23 family metallopeptidase [Erythrobacter crassostreae]|nr:M23 family metallopeptidase [Erythrobacter crassostrea]
MDHTRDISGGTAEQQEELFGAEGDARGTSGLDPSTIEGLAHYVQNSQPTKAVSVKQRLLSGFGNVGERYDGWRASTSNWMESLDLTPDLAEDIGSRRWFRGLGTMIGLGAVALMFWPSMDPLEARTAMPESEEIRDEFRSQMIMPLALGADSGRRMGPTTRVIPLESAPERPQISLLATLAPGDSFSSMLRRAGVSGTDIGQVSALVGQAMPLAEIEPGTQIDIVLGRRSEQGAPRPLDALKFRARFDLELEVARQGVTDQSDQGGTLALQKNVIRVDDTPLRVRGQVGSSLYRSMRAAGVPASAVQDYIKALDDQIDMDRQVRSTDEFDIVIAYRRAATGERQAGQLLFAGIDRDGQAKTQLMRWGDQGRFYEASGVGEQRNGLVAPVPGPISSRYGMRRHPILGYRRMHSGLDFRARRGTPIVAVTDGTVASAGRAGGCGNAVKLNHGGNLSTRYCHMSRMAVSRGQQVRRGQVIGYVGSTGLSTGPHLHYEMYRGGRSINPASVKFVTRAQLSGTELAEFKQQLNRLKEIEVGAALTDLEALPTELEEPTREIEKIDLAARYDN